MTGSISARTFQGNIDLHIEKMNPQLMSYVFCEGNDATVTLAPEAKEIDALFLLYY